MSYEDYNVPEEIHNYFDKRGYELREEGKDAPCYCLTFQGDLAHMVRFSEIESVFAISLKREKGTKSCGKEEKCCPKGRMSENGRAL